MTFTTQTSLIRSTFTAAFAALICIGCFISIPLPGGVPITIQNLFAILAGLILGGVQGAGAVGLFLVLGCIGIPVFSGGKGGVPHLLGPTGGFLIGYFVAALLAGLIMGTPHVREKKFTIAFWLRIVIAALAAYAVQYLIGVPWFMHVMAGKGTSLALTKALGYTLFPFIPGDTLKLLISVPLTAVLRPVVARYLYPDDEREAAELLEKLKARQDQN